MNTPDRLALAFAGRPPKLQRRAMAACRDDALRPCPGRLSSRVAAARRTGRS